MQMASSASSRNDGGKCCLNYTWKVYVDKASRLQLKIKKRSCWKPVFRGISCASRYGTLRKINVGTEPECGTLYSDGPIIQVPGQTLRWNCGTAQMATDQGYLQGENDYINSVVAMTICRRSWIHHVCDGPTTRSEQRPAGKSWSILF